MVLSATEIPGLQYVPNFITEEEASKLIAFLDSPTSSSQWVGHEMTGSHAMNRLTQQFGYTYDFGLKQLNTSKSKFVPFPEEFQFLLERLQPYFGSQEISNAIVNEYKGSQGIRRHLDRPQYFSNVIVSISLLQPCPFLFYEFEHVDWDSLIRSEIEERRVLTGKKAGLKLEANSLLVLDAEARYDWSHEIPNTNPVRYEEFDPSFDPLSSKSKDKIFFKRDDKFRRVSITFRSVLSSCLSDDE